MAIVGMKDVEYMGRNIDIDLDTQLLDNGKARLPEDWARRSKKRRGRGFQVRDFPLYASVICRAYELRNEESIRWGNIFRDIFFSERRLNVGFASLTKVLYDPAKHQDTIVHNFGTPQEVSVKKEIIPRREHYSFDPRIDQRHLKAISSLSYDKVYRAFSWILDNAVGKNHNGTNVFHEHDLIKCERHVSFSRGCNCISGRYYMNIIMNARNDEYNLLYGTGIRVRSRD